MTAFLALLRRDLKVASRNAIPLLMAGVQGVLMPLTVDLSGSREVDERLLAPISVRGVALEKVVAGAIHAAVAGLTALPAMMLLMHMPVPLLLGGTAGFTALFTLLGARSFERRVVA